MEEEVSRFLIFEKEEKGLRVLNKGTRAKEKK